MPHILHLTIHEDTEKVVLEAERKGKEFRMIETSVTVLGAPYGHDVEDESSFIDQFDDKIYDFDWRNVGATKWGRSQLMDSEGNYLPFSEAMKMFFEALDYSENMEFKELL